MFLTIIKISFSLENLSINIAFNKLELANIEGYISVVTLHIDSHKSFTKLEN
jgi:hypothetical protein